MIEVVRGLASLFRSPLCKHVVHVVRGVTLLVNVVVEVYFDVMASILVTNAGSRAGYLPRA